MIICRSMLPGMSGPPLRESRRLSARRVEARRLRVTGRHRARAYRLARVLSEPVRAFSSCQHFLDRPCSHIYNPDRPTNIGDTLQGRVNTQGLGHRGQEVRHPRPVRLLLSCRRGWSYRKPSALDATAAQDGTPGVGEVGRNCGQGSVRMASSTPTMALLSS